MTNLEILTTIACEITLAMEDSRNLTGTSKTIKCVRFMTIGMTKGQNYFQIETKDCWFDSMDRDRSRKPLLLCAYKITR